MKKFLCIVLAFVLVLALCACGSNAGNDNSTPSANPTVTPAPDSENEKENTPEASAWDFSKDKSVNLTFATYLSETDPSTVMLVEYMDKIKEATDGTVDYTLLAGGTLCSGAEELDALRNGLADVVWFPSAYGSGQLPMLYMFEYPGVAFANNTAASCTLNEWVETVQPAELNDYHVMFTCMQGDGCFLTSYPIRTYEDFANHQIRCGDALAPVLSCYGIQPTIMVFSEVYEGIRTGVVEGFYGLIPAANNIKLYEVASYLTYDPYYVGSYLMLMNQDVWNSLSEGQQAAINAVTEEVYTDLIAPGANDVEGALSNMEANGVELISLSDDDLAKMGEASSTVQNSYAAELDTKGYNGTEALELFKELGEKYNEMYGD